MKVAEMKIKALATDVDGTLTNSKVQLSCLAIKALRKLERKDIPVILVSGNALPVLKTLKRYIGCSGPIVCEGGAVVEHEGILRTVGDRGRGLEALKILKEAFGDRVVEVWSNQYRLIDIAIQRSIDKSEVLKVISKVCGVKLFDSGFAYHVVDSSVNKAGGLQIAGEMINVGLEKMAAIGDSEMDVDMLKAAGFKIALANAHLELKKLADYVTKYGDGRGVAEAVKLLLSNI